MTKKQYKTAQKRFWTFWGHIKMNVGYVRVSTTEQNTDRQKMILEKYNIEKIFEEKKSGKNTNRPKLEEMRNFVREGDVVFITDLSRLARSLADLLEITQEFQNKGVQLVSAKENIDTTSATGRLVFHLIGAIAEFERDLIHERQADGIASAKRSGKHLGRPHKTYDKDRFNELYELYQQRKITVSAIARDLKISRATVYRLIFDQSMNQK